MTVIDWLNESATEWMIESLIQWISESVNQSTNQSVNQPINQISSYSVSKFMNEPITCECVSHWTTEWTCERMMNERINELVSPSPRAKFLSMTSSLSRTLLPRPVSFPSCLLSALNRHPLSATFFWQFFGSPFSSRSIYTLCFARPSCNPTKNSGTIYARKPPFSQQRWQGHDSALVC